MNGVATATGLPIRWSTTENIAWKVPMPGRSGSTPIISGEHIFLNVGTADRSGDLELWALDRTAGKRLWTAALARRSSCSRKIHWTTIA